MFKCNVCGGEMDRDWPSGVCSAKCLHVGQGFEFAGDVEVVEEPEADVEVVEYPIEYLAARYGMTFGK